MRIYIKQVIIQPVAISVPKYHQSALITNITDKVYFAVQRLCELTHCTRNVLLIYNLKNSRYLKKKAVAFFFSFIVCTLIFYINNFSISTTSSLTFDAWNAFIDKFKNVLDIRPAVNPAFLIPII